MKFSHWLYFLIGLVVVFIPLKAEPLDKVKIQADSIYYTENNRIMVASSNVNMSFSEVTVNSQLMFMDVDEELLWGTGNIIIHRENDTMSADSFDFKLAQNELSVKNAKTVIHPFDATTGNIYIHADALTDKGGDKFGRGAMMTSCEDKPPHYFIWADYFSYQPDLRVIGYNVFIYSPIWFIPFGFWTPMYVFEIGKRNPILLPPKVGQNKLTGWFVENNLDYYLNESVSGNIYIDWREKKGVGVGALNKYKLNRDLYGNLYYYGIKEQDTGEDSMRFKWNQTLYLSDALRVKGMYQVSDMFRGAGGRTEDETKDIKIDYKRLGDSQGVSYYEKFNKIQNNQNLRFSYEKKFNNRQQFYFNHQKNENLDHGNFSETDIYRQELLFPYGFKLKNDVMYFKNRRNFEEVLDEKLRPKTTLSKPIFDIGDLSIHYDMTLDPDEDRVTRDANLEFVEKIPEIVFKLKPLKLTTKNVIASENYSLDFNEKILYGKYHEIKQVRSQTGKQKLRDLDPTGKWGFEQKVKATVKKLPLDLSLSASLGYDQYVYELGDQLYIIDQNYGWDTDWWDFFQLNFKYQNKYTGYDVFTGEQGNTPFYFDLKESIRVEAATYGTTFYLINPSKYKWSHTTGWNWVTQKRHNYSMEILIRPVTFFSLNLSTGYIFEENRIDEESVYQDLKTNINFNLLNPNAKTPGILELAAGGVGYLLGQSVPTPDVTNKARQKTLGSLFTIGFDKNMNSGKLIRLTNTLQLKIKDNWNLKTRFEYNQNTDDYKLKTVSFTKTLHRREMTILYNEALTEYQFIYTIHLYPKDKITITRNKNEEIKFEGGIFDDSETNRF